MPGDRVGLTRRGLRSSENSATGRRNRDSHVRREVTITSAFRLFFDGSHEPHSRAMSEGQNHLVSCDFNDHKRSGLGYWATGRSRFEIFKLRSWQISFMCFGIDIHCSRA